MLFFAFDSIKFDCRGGRRSVGIFETRSLDSVDVDIGRILAAKVEEIRVEFVPNSRVNTQRPVPNSIRMRYGNLNLVEVGPLLCFLPRGVLAMMLCCI